MITGAIKVFNLSVKELGHSRMHSSIGNPFQRSGAALSNALYNDTCDIKTSLGYS